MSEMNRLTRERILEIQRDAVDASVCRTDVISLCSMALEAVDGGWIAVSDSAPTLNSKVIVYGEDGDICTSGYGHYGFTTPCRIGKITHWRTLPIPTPPASSLEDGKQ